MDPKTNFEEVMAERFKRLPPTVQNAITSADVETHLRELAKTHQLHLDQWDLLENEVMLTLLGLAKTSELKQNIIKEVGVSDEVAAILAGDIAEHVFKPIRDELELQLEHPVTQVPSASGVAAAPAQVPSGMVPSPSAPTGQALAQVPPDTSSVTPSIGETLSGAALQTGVPPITTPTPTPPAPTTTPPPAPTEKTAGTAVASTYLSQTPSHERKTIEGDPYREQIS